MASGESLSNCVSRQSRRNSPKESKLLIIEAANQRKAKVRALRGKRDGVGRRLKSRVEGKSWERFLDLKTLGGGTRPLASSTYSLSKKGEEGGARWKAGGGGGVGRAVEISRSFHNIVPRVAKKRIRVVEEGSQQEKQGNYE